MIIACLPWLNGETANVLSNHISNHHPAAFRAYFVSLKGWIWEGKKKKKRWIWRQKRGIVDNFLKTWLSLGIICLDWVTYAKYLFLSSWLSPPGCRLSVLDPRMAMAKLTGVPCQIKAVTE